MGAGQQTSENQNLSGNDEARDALASSRLSVKKAQPRGEICAGFDEA
jgi:hypothetical protein